ncbi:MAG: hypothetical protein ACT4PL_08590 [Phycisphaerales bacterium]
MPGRQFETVISQAVAIPECSGRGRTLFQMPKYQEMRSALQYLFRRFDDILTFTRPTNPMVRQLIANRLAMFGAAKLEWKRVLAASKGLSHAEVVRGCEDAAKDVVMAGRKTVGTADLTEALRRRRSGTRSRRSAAKR